MSPPSRVWALVPTTRSHAPPSTRMRRPTGSDPPHSRSARSSLIIATSRPSASSSSLSSRPARSRMPMAPHVARGGRVVDGGGLVTALRGASLRFEAARPPAAGQRVADGQATRHARLDHVGPVAQSANELPRGQVRPSAPDRRTPRPGRPPAPSAQDRVSKPGPSRSARTKLWTISAAPTSRTRAAGESGDHQQPRQPAARATRYRPEGSGGRRRLVRPACSAGTRPTRRHSCT